MALEMRQSLKLQQSLALTPQLQQAIKLLQLNHLELVEAIQQELLENPTLEEVASSDPVETSDVERVLQDKAAADGADVAEQNNGQGEEIDWESVAQQISDHEPRERGASGLEDLPPIETNLVARGELSEHLAWQLQMQSCTDAEREAALQIVHNLDERGWLPMPLEDLVRDNDLDPEDAESALDIVQHLDPLGCGARGLEECLCIQAAVLWPGDDALQRLLGEHLPDLEKRNYTGIARALGVEHEDVLEYHRMIRTLEPWPGRAFTSGDPQYISPDVYVRKLGDEWIVTQNEDGLPKLRISKHYRKVLAGRDSTRAERDYIKERLGAADFLIKSIFKRQATIQRVMQCILRRQGDFFDRGPEHLRPMVLRDVAEELEVHESTVSRVTSNKYVHCPQGIFELKYFFTNGVNAVSGDQLAAEAVKRRIRRVIQDEDPANPLSDDAVVKLLVADNIDIARRTVAKYREAMGILPSSKRRNVC